MAEKDIPISVTKAMAEYDRKALNYGKETPIEDNTKKKLKWSTFSNNDELNACNKRTSCEKKVGDQSNIVDYIDFYPVKNKEDEEYLQILKELKERDNRKNEFKNINISSKEEAMKFLKSI